MSLASSSAPSAGDLCEASSSLTRAGLDRHGRPGVKRSRGHRRTFRPSGSQRGSVAAVAADSAEGVWPVWLIWSCCGSEFTSLVLQSDLFIPGLEVTNRPVKGHVETPERSLLKKLEEVHK